jgi:hypothetical protein
MAITAHSRIGADTATTEWLPMLVPPLVALRYPFFLEGFHASVTHIIASGAATLPWLSAAACLAPLSSELLRDREQLRESGLLQVLTPDAAVKTIRTFATTVPITHFYSWTLPPGLSPRWAQAHLELLASEVIPAFQ